MEISWRTVMILFGVMVVLLIVFDGIRRMRRARASALKLDISNDFRFPDTNSEIPGRVRVVSKKADPDIAISSQVIEPLSFEDKDDDVLDPSLHFNALETAVVTESRSGGQVPVNEHPQANGREGVSHQKDPLTADWMDANNRISDIDDTSEVPAAIIPKVRPANLDEDVPVLMSVEMLGAEPVVEVEPDIAESVQTDVRSENRDDGYVPEEESSPHFDDEIADNTEIQNHPSPLVIYAAEDAEQLAARPTAEVVLVIHVRARDEQGMSGLTLLRLFDGCDLRLGHEGIFHRFEEADGRGAIQFSIAQTWEPGVFDPVTMEDEFYAGLTLFMTLPGAVRAKEAYQAMAEMARLLAKHLNADLLDSSRSVYKMQTEEHDRQQIAEYERRQHLASKQRANGRR